MLQLFRQFPQHATPSTLDQAIPATMQQSIYPPLHFDYRPHAALPRLAWCAEMTRGEPAVVVHHGPWVETRADCFFEGAWNGAFEEERFDIAATFAGSGARLVPDGVLFVAPTHPVERIYALVQGNRLLVANSWVFLLVATGDQPDPTYPDYYFDLRHNFRQFHPTPHTLHTAKGHAIRLIDGRNMLVDADLAMRYQAKQLGHAPDSFVQLYDLMQTTTRQVVANAGHPARRHPYRPVTMISRGYDSTAASALAAQAGCTEAVTYAWADPGGAAIDDDGSPIAEILGMTPARFVRYAYRQRTDVPEAEFCIAGPLTWAPLAAMETTLAGSILFTGVAGYYWQDQSYKFPPYTISEIGSMVFPFTGITEFRLRTGFLNFPVLHVGAVHAQALRRIACSDAMRPWVVAGTSYNKPIQRRILEEAGVPRGLFGQPFKANAYAEFVNPRFFSTEGLADFTAFCAANGLPTAKTDRWPARSFARLSRGLHKGGTRLLRRIPPSTYFRLMPYTWWMYPKSAHGLWRSPALYTFHWSFEHTKQRYAIGD